MDIQCPCCGSYRIKQRNHAQKTLATIGMLAGASTGIRTVLYGGRIGMRLGMVAGPPGGTVGMVIGGIFGAFVSGGFGCSLGTAVGKQIDESILNNYLCCDCECTFSQSSDVPDAEAMLPYQAS